MSCVPKCIREDLIPKYIREDLYQLIPVGVIVECACCVLYDWHPRDDKKIDITICTKVGLIREYYKKDIINSIKLDGTNFKQMRILRNSQAALYYLVFSELQIIILSRKEILRVHRIIHDVRSYEIVDSECTGEAKVRIVTDSSVINLSIDNNFNIIEENSENSVTSKPEDTKPIFNTLKIKLNEAKYNLDCNKKAYKNILNLRQSASYSSQESNSQMETLTPNVIFCNKKILILLKINNPCNEPMEKVCTLIHNNSCNSISYSSKLFEIMSSSPFYREIDNQEMKSKQTAIVVAVIPLKEFDSSVSSKIEFNVVVSYQRNEKSYLQPCHNVYVSASEVMGKNFDVFSSEEYDYPTSLHLNMPIVLALLSATEKITLCIKQILSFDKATPDKFCKYLKMEFLGGSDKILVLKHSPHHILYGIMIIFHEIVENKEEFEIDFKIDVYARSPSQVLALIHFIYDSIPLQLIVTTPNIEMTSTESASGTLSQDYDEKMKNNFPELDYTHLASSLLKQASMTLAYFDKCLQESNTKNSDVQNINIFAMGFDKFAEYRRNMIAEAEKGIGHLPKVNRASIEEIFDENMEVE